MTGWIGCARRCGRRSTRRAAAVARLGADVTAAAAALLEECAPSARAELPKADRERVRDALADAAGVPTVVRAVASAHRRRGALAAGWPFARWLKRLRPDPLRRLRLPDQPEPDAGTSLPGASPVQREQVAAATRALAAGAVARPAGAVAQRRPPRRDGARGAGGRPARPRRRGRRPPRRAAALVVARGRAPEAARGRRSSPGCSGCSRSSLLAWLQLDDVVPLPECRGIPVPTLLLLGGVAAGLVLAFVVRLVNGAAARRRARAAERSLRARVDEVAEELVLGPVAGRAGGAPAALRAAGCSVLAFRRDLPAADRRLEPRSSRGLGGGARAAAVRQQRRRLDPRGGRRARRSRPVLGDLRGRDPGRVRDDQRRRRRSRLLPAVPLEALHRRALPGAGLRHGDARPRSRSTSAGDPKSS